MKNEIWKMDYRTVRCHTESAPKKTALLKYMGASVANTYFFKREKGNAWDIDIPADKRHQAERLLNTGCDNSTADTSSPLNTGLSIEIRKISALRAASKGGKESFEPVARFEQAGCLYELIEQNELFAIYSLKHIGDSQIVGYDVVLVSGNYPKSEKWGTTAWSFDCLEAAETKVKELQNV